LALTPGTRLGIYDITAQIGEGGIGQEGWRKSANAPSLSLMGLPL